MQWRCLLEGRVNMEETGMRDLDEQARERFHKIGLVCYDRWRRSNLLEVAVASMPKQVNKYKI